MPDQEAAEERVEILRELQMRRGSEVGGVGL